MITYVPEPEDPPTKSSLRHRRSTCSSTALLDLSGDFAEGSLSTLVPEDGNSGEDNVSSDTISLGSCYRHFYKDLPSQVFSINQLPSLDQSSVSEHEGPSTPLCTTPVRTPVAMNKQVFRQQPSTTVASGKMLEIHTPSTQCSTLASLSAASSRRNCGATSPLVPLLPAIGIQRLDDSSASLGLTEKKSLVLSDSFNVAIRLRPLPPQEETKTAAKRRRWPLQHHKQVESELETAWTVSSSVNDDDNNKSPTLAQSDATRQIPGRNLFSFDSIFQGDQSTASVYDTLAKPIVEAVVTGRHGTVFAYGQTGSGKTHTMQGSHAADHAGCDAYGIVQMAAVDMLQHMQADKDRRFQLTAQFFEIYNEQVRDLLQPVAAAATTKSSSSSPGRRRSQTKTTELATLSVREDDHGEVSVNARSETIQTVTDVEAILKQGNRNRACAATCLNARSSRSHAIFRLTLESHSKDPTDAKVRRSVLNLVDLAGSENSAQAGITGIRKKEAGKINQSLLSLSRVIHSLSLPAKKRPKHIGYRNSKLTRIMQPHLSGNACLAVLCCISPARKHLEESRSTLKFADSAKRIKVKPTVNEVLDQKTMLLALQKELQTTKDSLKKLQETISHDPSVLSSVLDEMPLQTTDSYISRRQRMTPQQRGNPAHEQDDTDASSEVVLGEEDLKNADKSAKETMPEIAAASVPGTSTATSSSPPMHEVVVLVDCPTSNFRDTEARMDGTEERVKFLSNKLEATDDLVEALFKELREAQEQNLNLDMTKTQLDGHISQLQEQEVVQQAETSHLVQQCLLLKYAIVLGLVLYVTGQSDLFLGTVFFLWLSLVVVTH